MERLELRMRELATRLRAELGPHAGSTIAAGGKRLRPLLVFLAAGVPTPETDELLVRAAVAVELVHAATLVHDDVLDGSALRRGRPTVVATGGRAGATATGDLLFSRAFAELARWRLGDGGASPVARPARSSPPGELMQRADAWDAVVSVERYLERCRLKTAVLFRAACELGALARAVPTRRARRSSASGSGSRSRCSTTCSTSPARPSGPASLAARTCSTAR